MSTPSINQLPFSPIVTTDPSAPLAPLAPFVMSYDCPLLRVILIPFAVEATFDITEPAFTAASIWSTVPLRELNCDSRLLMSSS